MNNVFKGTLMAVAAAGLFACKSSGDAKTDSSASGGTAAADSAEMVKCSGINECKGQGQCGAPGPNHACAGSNECAGKGWIRVSATDCAAKNGTVVN